VPRVRALAVFPREALPAGLAVPFGAGRAALAGLGFDFLALVALPGAAPAGPTGWSEVFHHGASGDYARLHVGPLGEWQVTFNTEGADGTRVMTVDALAVYYFGIHDGTVVQDGLVGDLAAQWQLHEAEVQRHGGASSRLPMGPDELCRELQDREEAMYASAAAAGELREAGADWRLTFGAALRQAVRLYVHGAPSLALQRARLAAQAAGGGGQPVERG
jgi:hypothetical protein